MKKFLISFLGLLAVLGLVSCGDNTEKTQTPDEPTKQPTKEPTPEVLPQEDDKIHLIILTGQSGARGKALNN